jgi:hypothetical protein
MELDFYEVQSSCNGKTKMKGFGFLPFTLEWWLKLGGGDCINQKKKKNQELKS